MEPEVKGERVVVHRNGRDERKKNGEEEKRENLQNR